MDRSSVLAADIANELANQLILNSPTNLTAEDQQRREIIESELTALGEQITQTRTEIQQIDEQLDGTSDPQRIDALREQRGALVALISQWQQAVADLSLSLNTFSERTNTLRVVEPALVPVDPVGTGILQQTFLAILIGLAFAVGVILLLEYLDDTFRDPGEVRAALNIPLLAGIVKFGNRRENYNDKLVALKAPNSSPVEGYRALRTNLLYGFEEGSHKRIVVTSAHVSEGKSITAANLAVSLARAEINTVIVDTDLHRPQIHNIFRLDNRVGLSNLFDIPMRSAQLIPLEYLGELLKPTDLPYLRVITSGPLPSNPAELLGMPYIPSLCRSLEETLGVEMIIFDTPPVLSVVDTATLASNIDASVILVIRANRTRRDSAIRVLDQFAHVGVHVVGTVLNNITQQADGYYYYYYGYGGYRDSETEPRKSAAR
jgi:capsular exopolysaccharide synthesis family protein